MIQRLKRTLITLAAVMMPALTVAMPAAVSAETPNIPGSVDKGTCLTVEGTGCPEGEPGDQVNSLVADIINIFSWVVGVVAVIMIIVGGFRYITSGGNDANVGAAKNTIMYAVIGLVIVALAQFIVRFVLNTATQTTP